MYSAIVLGGTGLVGSQLIDELIDDNSCQLITLIGRSDPKILSPKVVFESVDFDNQNDLLAKTHGDVLFIAFGTTIKTAKSKENFEKIDAGIPINVAKAAKQNGIEKVVIVTALGADEKSPVFYNHIKGKIENTLIGLDFSQLCILRPSLLLGERGEKRFGEKIAQNVFSKINFLFVSILKKYKAVSATQVAKAMLYFYKNTTDKIKIIENEQSKIFLLPADFGPTHYFTQIYAPVCSWLAMGSDSLSEL